MAFRSIPTTLYFESCKKTDANLKDFDCTVQMLLFFSMYHCSINECFNLFFFREDFFNFYELKKNLDIEEFCKVYPKSIMFCDLLMDAKGLKFEEKPDYEKMRKQMYQNLKE